MLRAETTDLAIGAGGLVRAALAGDEQAFAAIVDAYHADMVRVSYVVCGDLMVAEDAAAAAWPICWRRLSTLRDPDRIRPWLISIAVNEARRLSRRARRRSVVEIRLDAADAMATADPAARIADLDLLAAFERLDPDDRALLALRYVADLSSTELSHAAGLTPSGVRARVGRLLERLRRDLDRA